MVGHFRPFKVYIVQCRGTPFEVGRAQAQAFAAHAFVLLASMENLLGRRDEAARFDGASKKMANALIYVKAAYDAAMQKNGGKWPTRAELAAAMKGSNVETLTGTAQGGTDTVVLTSPGGPATATAADTVLNLQGAWTTADFIVSGEFDHAVVEFAQGKPLTM